VGTATLVRPAISITDPKIAILGSVIEIAGLTKVAVPTLRNIAACIGVLDQRILNEGLGIGPLTFGDHL